MEWWGWLIVVCVALIVTGWIVVAAIAARAARNMSKSLDDFDRRPPFGRL